jgi:chemotaxis protein MotA
VVDGVDVKLIEEVMTTELDSRKGRHKDVKETIDLMASVFPAFGLIGTIMGLVGLLKNMDDPAAIGPNMALALITTFYGAVTANMFLIPLGKKVEERSASEDLYGEIITRGCLLIAGGTHPRIIQERLLSYLSDKERKTFNELHLSEELKQGGKA